MTEQVGLRALQQNASAVVARAAAGEVVEVTDRGRPVARIVPLAANGLEALITAGLARRSRQAVRDIPPPLPAAPAGPTLGELLAEAREGER